MGRVRGGWIAVGSVGVVGLALLGWVRGLERVVLRAGGDSGAAYEASLWVADEGSDVWVEAPDAQRDWYAALLDDPLVWVERSGRSEQFRAQPEPRARARVERLYRAKYGIAHTLRAWLEDRSHVIPIRLARMPAAGSRA